MVCVLTLLFDLSAVASIGSVVALIIFMMECIAHLKLIEETGANRLLVYLSIITCAITLAAFCIDTLPDEPGTAVALVVFLGSQWLSIDIGGGFRISVTTHWQWHRRATNS